MDGTLEGSAPRRLFACIRGQEVPVVFLVLSSLASRDQNSAGMMSLGSSGWLCTKSRAMPSR